MHRDINEDAKLYTAIRELTRQVEELRARLVILERTLLSGYFAKPFNANDQEEAPG